MIKILGVKPLYFRPPFGLYNILIASCIQGFRYILQCNFWSLFLLPPAHPLLLKNLNDQANSMTLSWANTTPKFFGLTHEENPCLITVFVYFRFQLQVLKDRGYKGLILWSQDSQDSLESPPGSCDIIESYRSYPEKTNVLNHETKDFTVKEVSWLSLSVRIWLISPIYNQLIQVSSPHQFFTNAYECTRYRLYQVWSQSSRKKGWIF